MQAACLFVFLFLLAVCADIPSVFGASITPYTEHEAVEVFKRQWSAGANGSYSKDGWGVGGNVDYTFAKGRGSVGGNVGYDSKTGGSVGVGLKWRLRK